MASEKRLIDVNPIIERYSGGETMKSMAECIHDEIFVNVLKNAPIVDAVEVVHGRWERFEEFSGNIGVSCSVCGWKDYHHGRYKGNLFHYCPNCGAKMDGKENQR